MNSGTIILTAGLRRPTFAKAAVAVAAFAVSPALVAYGGMEGLLRVQVADASGQGVPARISLIGRSPEFRAGADADAFGVAVLRRVPPGVYLLSVRRDGFEPFERFLEVRSAVPQRIAVELKLGVVQTEVNVRGTAPLFDRRQPAAGARVGRKGLDEALGTPLGRSVIDAVTTLPGWLLEAHAVLHPRGSEYDTQYVIDGMPLYDNRSIAFAPPFESSEFAAVTVLTAGLPAEYGRRLGGVIALDTRRAETLGNRSSLALQGGSFGTRTGAFSHQYAAKRTVAAVGIQAGSTDRYLDPPSLANFTNRGHSSGANARLERDLRGRDRLTFYGRSNRTRFLVPNDLAQQEAGQRQDRQSVETGGQVHYQGALSNRTLLSVRGMARDLTSELWSNRLATPVYVQQDRGFREGAVMGDLTYDLERHTIKFGGDLRLSGVRERFLLAEPDQAPDFGLQFRDRRRSVESSLYAQDQFRFGNFAANLGVRFDHYRLLVSDQAISPRLACSYYAPQAKIQFFASYDRVFQPPPIENLLLSSLAPGLGLEAIEGALPVPASRAHFFEVGFRKPVGEALRFDAKHYWRRFRHMIDDDVFLNTGLSFPITFDSARVQGTEFRLEMPNWRGVSSFVSYSNLIGRVSSPVTGGLFIEGGEAEELRDAAESFPISQDQRNTVAAQVRFQFHPRIWAAAGIRYGSGLPVELEDDDDDDEGEGEPDDDDDHDDESGIPPEILSQVNFERGRVLPNLSVDFSVGTRIWERNSRSVTAQFDLRNATNRLNVINFSGLFSGTALAPGRQATLQLRLRF